MLDLSKSTIFLADCLLFCNAIEGGIIVEAKVARVDDVVSFGVARKLVELSEVAWPCYQPSLLLITYCLMGASPLTSAIHSTLA